MYLLLYQLFPNDHRPLVAPKHRKKAETHSKYQMNVLNTKKTKNTKLLQCLANLKLSCSAIIPYLLENVPPSNKRRFLGAKKIISAPTLVQVNMVGDYDLLYLFSRLPVAP